MSLASIPDVDDTQGKLCPHPPDLSMFEIENSKTNAIRVCNDSVPSYHSCMNLATVHSLTEINADFPFARGNSMDKIRMSFKSKAFFYI